MGSEAICLGLYERPDGAVGSAESPLPGWVPGWATLREWFARYTHSTDIAIQQASDGTESNLMGVSEA